MDDLAARIPKDEHAEEAVIGSLILDRDVIVRVAPLLRPADFQNERLGMVYGAVLALYDRAEPADMVTLASELERRGELDKVGGYAFLMGLVDACPTSVHAEYYAQAVVDRAIRRRVISACTRGAAEAYTSTDDIDTLIAKVETMLSEATKRHGRGNILTLKDALAEFSAELEALEENGIGGLGVPSGFVDLDKITGGWQPGKLVVIAARPGTGKTSLVLNMAKHAAERGHAGGIFSLEMARQELVHRLIADEAQISSYKLTTGQYITDQERTRLHGSIGKLSELKKCIEDTANISIQELRSKAFRMKAEHGISILFVDYLQLVTAPRKDGNRVLEVGEVARKLKVLGRELDIPVIVCAQLNRAVEQRQNHVPMLSDLRDSGEIEQHADIVIFIHREEMYKETPFNSGVAELHIAKHRAGPLGVVTMRFVKERTLFQSMTRVFDREYED